MTSGVEEEEERRRKNNGIFVRICKYLCKDCPLMRDKRQEALFTRISMHDT